MVLLMRWVVGAVGGVVLLIAIVLFVVPAAGGPQPGAIATRPSEERCAALVADNDRQPETISVGWIWASDGYGWGCRYRYPDGSTGTHSDSPMLGDPRR